MKRNGKGKTYNYGHLIYFGEIVKGKKNGKEKEYDDYGKLIFEGEYLNGEKWNGKAKEYFKKNDKLMFEREYLNCKK